MPYLGRFMAAFEAIDGPLRDDEGVRSFVYKCPADKLTIGIGRNLEDRGLSTGEIDYLFHNDKVHVLEASARLLERQAGWSEPEIIRFSSIHAGVACMVFQLGENGTAQFRAMFGALRHGDWDLAATEALDSKWARQTPNRAARVAAWFRAQAGEL